MILIIYIFEEIYYPSFTQKRSSFTERNSGESSVRESLVPGIWEGWEGTGLLLLFSSKVVSISDSLWFHELQHSRLLCRPPSPVICSNSCPLSHWCYLTSSSSAALFFFCLQSFPASRVFSSESALCIRWPKYWRFSFSISPSNEYSGLISFRVDWFDLLTAQGTLESLLQ